MIFYLLMGAAAIAVTYSFIHYITKCEPEEECLHENKTTYDSYHKQVCIDCGAEFLTEGVKTMQDDEKLRQEREKRDEEARRRRREQNAQVNDMINTAIILSSYSSSSSCSSSDSSSSDSGSCSSD